MQVKTIVLKTFFPRHCLLCKLTAQNDQMICDDCYQTLPRTKTRCNTCGNKTLMPTKACDTCTNSPPAFDRTHILFDYEKPISSLITTYKFHETISLSQFFANEWISFFTQHKNNLPDILIPTPLHSQRLKERGFNQALEIAKPLAKHFHIPIDTTSCIRTKNTVAQAQLSLEKRQRNIKHAFTVQKRITAHHVGILDDVLTTGNTLQELSTVLKKQGVETISLFCCARA